MCPHLIHPGQRCNCMMLRVHTLLYVDPRDQALRAQMQWIAMDIPSAFARLPLPFQTLSCVALALFPCLSLLHATPVSLSGSTYCMCKHCQPCSIKIIHSHVTVRSKCPSCIACMELNGSPWFCFPSRSSGCPLAQSTIIAASYLNLHLSLFPPRPPVGLA